MKKSLFCIVLLTVLSAKSVIAGEEYATVRVMCPGSLTEAMMSTVASAFFSTIDVSSYQYYIAADDEFVGEIKYGEYTDVKVAPGTYNFNLYMNCTKRGIKFVDCTFDRAKAEGRSFVYKNITVEAGRTYYIDVCKLKRTLAKPTSYDLAMSQGKLVKRENTVQNTSANTQLAATAAPEPAQAAPVITKKNSIVDENIPTSKTANEDTYVLIIANENYQELSSVTYAANDGQIFKQYCTQTLGVPESQVRYYPNASYGQMVGAVDWLSYALNNFDGAKAIVYYCGHGIPDEKTSEPYLIPVDGKGTNMKTCYSLKELYKTLAASKAQSITYFMDACFTGANKEGGMLVAARGVARAPEKETLGGKTIVFSASSGDETAMTLDKEGHGLFTYYLLKKLQETKGDVSYGDLADYLNKNVKKDAFLINEKPQTPVVATSPAVVNTWKTMKLK